MADAYDDQPKSTADADKDPIVVEALEAFRECQEAERENREEALEDLRFGRLGDQWPELTKVQREKDGRPMLTVNKLPAIIRQVVNDIRQNKPEIKTSAMDTVADPATAILLDALIRQIEYSSRADEAYDWAAEMAISCGVGYYRINTAYSHDDAWDMDIILQRIFNPLSVWRDPESESATSDDWNVAFVSDMLSKKAFAKRYKGAAGANFNFDDTAYSGLNEDWRSDNFLRVAEYWKREEAQVRNLLLTNGSVVRESLWKERKGEFQAAGVEVIDGRMMRSFKVCQYILSGCEVLEERPWLGRYIPIIPVYGEEVNVEGRRVLRSLVRDARDPQRMFNYWRTGSTEMVALAPKVPFIGPKGAFNYDQDKWDTAHVEQHAYIEYDGPVAPTRQPLDSGPAAGAIAEAANANDDMKGVIGLHDPSLGAPGNETSGRAILARIREGDVSTFHFADNLHRSIRHAGTVVMDLIPYFYDNDRAIRVLGPDQGKLRTPQVVQLGRPQPKLGEDLQPMKQTALDPRGQPIIDPVTQQPVMQEVLHTYDLTVGKYDVAVKAGPSFTTRREEAASQMLEMMKANPELTSLIGDLFAEASDWPMAPEIARRFQAMLPPQVKGEDPAVQALQQQLQQVQVQAQQQLEEAQSQVHQMQAAVADMQVRIDKEKDRTHVDLLKVQLEFKRVELEAMNAYTERLKAMAALQKEVAGITSEQVAEISSHVFSQLMNDPDLLSDMMTMGADPSAQMEGQEGAVPPEPQAMPPAPAPEEPAAAPGAGGIPAPPGTGEQPL